MPRKILYIDLDSTLVDFAHRIEALDPDLARAYAGRLDEIPGMFALMRPMPGALAAYAQLSEVFDTYILSTAPWENPSAWQHTLEWVHLHLGRGADGPAYKRLILSHHKNLNRGDFLVDDRPHNGASNFEGEWVKFGEAWFDGFGDKPDFVDWPAVVAHLLPLA